VLKHKALSSYLNLGGMISQHDGLALGEPRVGNSRDGDEPRRKSIPGGLA